MVANRTGLQNRSSSKCGCTRRVLATSVKDAPLTPSGYDFSLASRLGAGNPRWHGSRRLALWIPGARQKGAETSFPDHHGFPANLTWKRVFGNRGKWNFMLVLGRPWPGCLAGRVSGASEEGPETPLFDHHRLSANLAKLVDECLWKIRMDTVLIFDIIHAGLAFWIAGTGEIAAIFTPFTNHFLAACRAVDIGWKRSLLEVFHSPGPSF